MKPIRNYIDNAKIRLSWGLTGNNRVGEYASYGLYDVQKSWGGQVTLGSVPSGVYPFNGNLSNVGMVPTSVPNKDLKWETTEQWNLGFDLSFLQERIGVTVDLYRKTTRDLLLNSNLPLSSGFVSAMKNIGKVRNQGIEFTLNTTNIKNKKFEWTSNFNIAFNQNRVIELAEGQSYRNFMPQSRLMMNTSDSPSSRVSPSSRPTPSSSSR